jgi:hypothetical protein
MKGTRIKKVSPVPYLLDEITGESLVDSPEIEVLFHDWNNECIVLLPSTHDGNETLVGAGIRDAKKDLCGRIPGQVIYRNIRVNPENDAVIARTGNRMTQPAGQNIRWNSVPECRADSPL